MPAHTDYVKITYVAAKGETPASAESSLSQPADALTIVKSPPPLPGALGYNVYAVLNNGGSGTGETLQNTSPIAIGVDYQEPRNGWIATGLPAPSGAAPFDIRKFWSISAPASPQLVSGVCGSFVTHHTEVVKLTYVTSNGESLAGAQAQLVKNTDAPMIVHSPPMVDGVLGYNVYATKDDNVASAMGTLQNRSPIVIGTDFKEPRWGWTTIGRAPPTTNTAYVAYGTPIAITQSGGYVDATAPNGPREAFILPANDAPPSTSLTVDATQGLPIGAPPPRSDAAAGTPKSTVVETIEFAFSNDVTFNGYPTFKLTLPKVGMQPPPPYIVELYDGSTKALLATMPAFNREDLTFLSDYTSRYKILRNRRYYAELLAHSPFSVAVATARTATKLALPSIAGIGASLILPAAATAKNSARIEVCAAAAPPVGLPNIPNVAGLSPLYYASIVVNGTAVPSKPAFLTVKLPRRAVGGALSFRLAAYDAGFASSGWHMGIAPITVTENVLRFKLALPNFLAFRQYGVAFYALSAEASKHAGGVEKSSASSDDPADIVVVGDSLSVLSILPPSGAGCVAGWGPLPQCQYSIDPSLNWPGYLAKMTGRPVRNLSQLGAETMVDEFFGASMLGLQVPQIRAKTRVVIVDWGIADLGVSGGSPATRSHAASMTKAILARAPRARIVYLGIHCPPNCPTVGVDAWNDEDKQLAKKYGVYIDLRDIAPDGVSAAFPDGGHPSLAAAQEIATKVAAAIRGLNLSIQ